jgi:hypothetical protein
MATRTLLMSLLTLLMCGCIADNKTKQGPVTIEHKPQIKVPAPVIETKEIDTGKLVDDMSARFKADMSSNSNQLSGHIVAQLQKLEMNLKGLVNLEAKVDNKMQAELRADLTNTMTAMAKLEATINTKLEAHLNVSNEMNANLSNSMKALSDIQTKLGNVSGQADATAAGQVGLKNEISKMQTTLQSEIKATAGRDVNMWPMSAVLTVIGIMVVMGGLIYGITIFLGKKAYEAARQRQDNYARRLMVAMGEMEPERSRELMSKIPRGDV